MKRKIYFFVALMLFSLLGISQSLQLTNNSFDTWNQYTGVMGAKFWRPDNWPGVSNVHYLVVNYQTIFRELKSSDQSIIGDAALKTKSFQVNAMGVNRVAPGMISQANFWNTSNMSSAAKDNDAGFYMNTSPAFTGRPEAMKVRIKSVLKNGDNNVIRVISWTGEEYEQSRSTASGIPANNNKYVKEANKVCDTRWTNTTPYSQWTEITIPLVYKPGKEGTTPTKMNVCFAASNYDDYDFGGSAPQADSELWVDGCVFIYPAKLNNIRVGGNLIADFDRNVFEYNYKVDESVMTVPTISSDGAYLGGTITNVTQATSVPGTATITVRSEEGDLNTYRVNLYKEYNITLTPGTGYTIVPEDGYTNNVVSHGGDYKFKVNLQQAYSNSIITVKANGVTLNPQAGVYTINNIMESKTITVEGVTMNKYTVTLPSGTGYTVEARSGSVSPVTHGGSYSFAVVLTAPYSNSNVVVMSNGSVVNNLAGVYTITNIVANQTVTVDGVTINKYAITLPTGAGYNVVPESGYEVPTVEYDKEYKFKVNIDEAYSNSTVTVRSNGLTVNADVNGVYTISNVKAAQNVVVSGVVLNKYTILWTNPSGGNITVKNGANNVVNGSQVNHGTILTVTVNPYSGYAFESMLINGVEYGNMCDYVVVGATQISATVKLAEYNVTWSNPVGATIEVKKGATQLASGDAIAYNDVIQIIVTPQVGYTTEQVLVNGTPFAGTNYTVKGSIVISATVRINTYAVAWNNPAGVAILVNNNGMAITSGSMVSHGSSLTITATPEVSHNLTSLKVNNEDFVSGATLTVTSPVNIVATSAIKTYTINVIQAENGTISPATAVVNYGGSQTFAINADDNYSVKDVLVDGLSVGKRGSYTFSNVTANHTITAVYEYTPDMFNINLPSVDGVIVEALKDYESPVIEGADFKFSVTLLPSHSNSVPKVKVNGEEIAGVNNVYTITNITEHKVVTIENVVVNVYTVTLPTSVSGVTVLPVNENDYDVNYGESFTFRVILDPEYSQSINSYVVSANGTQIHSTNGNFVVNNITDNIVITVTGVEINKYSVAFPNVVGATFNPLPGYQTSNIIHGNDFKFEVVLSDAYNQSEYLVFANGNALQSNANVFTISDVDNNQIITIQNVVKNTYQVTLPNIAGATIKGIEGYDNIVEYGDDFKFTVELDIAYSMSNVEVFIGSEQINLNEGVYTINNIINDIDVRITGIEINRYKVTLPIVEGVEIMPAYNYDSNNVVYNGKFKFTLRINPAYNQSAYTVLANGNAIFETVDGVYVIDYITEDYQVTVSGVEKNVYYVYAPVVAGAAIEVVNGSYNDEKGAYEVYYGEQFNFNVVLEQAYNQSAYRVLSDVGGKLQPVAGNAFVVNNITENVHLYIDNVVLNTYLISVMQSSNGTITPSTISVVHGQSQTFDITPNQGFQVQDVYADGVSVGAVNEYTFENVSANHTITAIFKAISYTINVEQVENGQISPSAATVEYGANQSFTIRPNVGCHIVDVLVDGVSVGVRTNYTFVNVKSNHTITALFGINQYEITVVQNANGTIAPNSALVNHGGSQTFDITPDNGYQVTNVRVNGIDLGALSSYTFEDVTSNQIITASYDRIIVNQYVILASCGDNGTITPAGIVTVNEGDEQVFNIMPNAGYEIYYIMVDGELTDVANQYTFENITSNHVIVVEFRPATGVNDITTLDAKIYSNGRNIYVLTSEVITGDVEVIDINGRLVGKYSIDGNQTVVTMPNQGVYIVRLTSEGIVIRNQKLVLR